MKDYAETWISQRPGFVPALLIFIGGCRRSTSRPRRLGNVRWQAVPAMIRQWRADLLGNGVSISVAAKAYPSAAGRSDDGCRRRPHHPAQPVPDPRGRRRAGRRAPAAHRSTRSSTRGSGGPSSDRATYASSARLYRLRYQRNGEMRTHPETFATRGAADGALWKLGMDGRADCTQDRRFRALVLLPPSPACDGAEVSALSSHGCRSRRRDGSHPGGLHRAFDGRAGSWSS